VQIVDFSGEELEDVAGEFLLSRIARTRPDFRGRVAFQELGEAGTLCRSHWGGPLRIFRTERMAARASEDNLMLFCVQMAGESSHHQHDRFAQLAAGTGVLKETRSAYERMSAAETRSLTLRFPRELLPIRAAEVTEGCARSVDPAAPAMRVLSGYLGRLFEVAEDLTATQRLDAGCAAIDLLAMVLRDVTPSVPGGDGPGEVLLEMMQVHVREHLADPGLRVAELARRHHVSVRHAHTLFERIGTTPGVYIREQRLLEARAMLSDPRYAHLGMQNVAAAVGILNLRTFERAFRRQYGMKPSSWRREHLPTGSARRP
jgi:AraC-like DNA-binding protein